MTAADAIVEEFGTRYHGDIIRVDDRFRENLPTTARKSARRLAATGAADLVDTVAALKQKNNPLLRRIEDESLIDWTDDELTWTIFGELIDHLIENINQLRSSAP